jgi:VWFA-related protein
MRMRWTVAALVLAMLLVSAVPISGQGLVSVSIDELQFDEYPKVKALVTVRNENGVPIAGLEASRFEIVEDGRASFPPSEATAKINPGASVSVVMVVDISGSMEGTPVKEAIRAANALLDQLSAQDRAAVIAFADDVDTNPANLEEGKEVGFTTDKNAVRNVVNFLDTKIGWDTPLYDAIYKGIKMVQAEPPGKRAVVVLTDGRDERDNAQGVAVKDAGSLSAPDDPINEANRHNIPIFSIGLEGIGGKIDTKYLRRLAERTGGVYQRAPEPEELTPLFENVVDELKQQYILSYETGQPEDDTFHSLLVRVQLPQGQAFNETKYQIRPTEEQPLAPTAAPDESASAAVASQDETPVPVEAVAETEPASSGVSGIIDTVRSFFEERTMIAIVIGVGLLLLLILIIALVVVLLRGRGAPEEEFASEELDVTYGPAPAWSPGPTDPGTPVMGPPARDMTELAPSDWPGAAPAIPPVGRPPQPLAPDTGIPPAGGTRVIERAPKHLAMLVDRTRPDNKFDLKGTVNVGRGKDNQIVLDHPTVSRQHAWVKAEGEDFSVFDVGSANGTFVNDERVQEPHRLENGDVVRFGEMEFVFTKVF